MSSTVIRITYMYIMNLKWPEYKKSIYYIIALFNTKKHYGTYREFFEKIYAAS